jgi:hypothetical protein
MTHSVTSEVKGASQGQYFWIKGLFNCSFFLGCGATAQPVLGLKFQNPQKHLRRSANHTAMDYTN